MMRTAAPPLRPPEQALGRGATSPRHHVTASTEFDGVCTTAERCRARYGIMRDRTCGNNSITRRGVPGAVGSIQGRISPLGQYLRFVCVCLSVCLPVCLSGCLSVCLSVCQGPVCLPCLSVCLSAVPRFVCFHGARNRASLATTATRCQTWKHPSETLDRSGPALTAS